MITLVRAIAGSKLYGLNTHESDDDFMGIFIPSPEEKLGLSCREQIVESPDSTIYELGKYVRLAVGGNPTILQLLYTPEDKWTQWDDRWLKVQQSMRRLCVSQKCRSAFLGYLQQQKQKMLSDRQQRPELVEKYGYDTKFGMHAIRLGQTGVRLLEYGEIEFPMATRDDLMNIRAGLYSKEYIIERIEFLESELKAVQSVLPVEPDIAAISKWLASTYKEFWG